MPLASPPEYPEAPGPRTQASGSGWGRAAAECWLVVSTRPRWAGTPWAREDHRVCSSRMGSGPGGSRSSPLHCCPSKRGVRDYLNTNGLRDSALGSEGALCGQTVEGPPGSCSQLIAPNNAEYWVPFLPRFSTVSCPYPSILPHHIPKRDLSSCSGMESGRRPVGEGSSPGFVILWLQGLGQVPLPLQAC